MAFSWATGFEYGIDPVITGSGLCNEISATGGSAISVSSAIKRSGSYSLRMQGVAGSACFVLLPVAPLFRDITTTLAFRFYYRVETLPASGATNVAVLNNEADNDIVGLLTIDSAGQFHLSTSGGTAQNGPTIVAGDGWHLIELLGDASGTTWTCDWRIDGVGYTQSSEAGHAAENIRRLYLSADSHASGTTDVYYDDLLAGTGSQYPIGAGSVLLAPLNGTAAHQSITASQWATTTDFSTFSDFTGANETVSPPLLAPPISTATPTGFRMDAGAGGQAGNGRWPIDAPTGAPGTNAQLVAAIIAVREASTGTNDATFRTELGGSTTNIFTGNPGWGTTWNYLGSFMAIGPGSAAWTPANVEAMNFECDSTDSAPNIWCQGVVYEVAYAASTSLMLPNRQLRITRR